MWLRNYFLTLFEENKTITGWVVLEWKINGKCVLARHFKTSKYRCFLSGETSMDSSNRILALVYSGQIRDTSFPDISNTGWDRSSHFRKKTKR